MTKCNLLIENNLDYEAAHQLQKDILSKRINDEVRDTLLITEHPPVYTIGKGGNEDNLLIPKDRLETRDIKVHNIERGGDITFHGPGQIVGYPILNIKDLGIGIHGYVNKLEEIFIELLKDEYKIDAKRISEYPGVWVGNNKITALGINVQKWVTWHGFAFNVNTDLSYFDFINPCGIKEKGVTSIQDIIGSKVDMDQIKSKVIEYFKLIFGYDEVIQWEM